MYCRVHKYKQYTMQQNNPIKQYTNNETPPSIYHFSNTPLPHCNYTIAIYAFYTNTMVSMYPFQDNTTKLRIPHSMDHSLHTPSYCFSQYLSTPQYKSKDNITHPLLHQSPSQHPLVLFLFLSQIPTHCIPNPHRINSNNLSNPLLCIQTLTTQYILYDSTLLSMDMFCTCFIYNYS